MSYESKQLFIRDMSKALESIVTVSELEAIEQVTEQVLAKYEMERLSEGEDIESEDLLEMFLSAKKVEGCSPRTLTQYKYVLGTILKDIGLPVKEITVYQLRQWFANEKKRGISDRTLSNNRQVMSTFFGWLQKDGLIRHSPIANLSAIKYAKVVRKPYSTVDLEHLKECCETPRDRAIVGFLLSTGCRIGEMCDLDRDAVNFTTKECKVIGKGNKERIVFVDDVTAMLLMRYLDSRKDNNPALFLGKGDKRFKQGGVRAMLKRVAHRASVSNCHPHRFRRTLATTLIDHGMPIHEVAFILGHEKIDTTMTYIYTEKNNVHNSYKKYV